MSSVTRSQCWDRSAGGPKHLYSKGGVLLCSRTRASSSFCLRPLYILKRPQNKRPQPSKATTRHMIGSLGSNSAELFITDYCHPPLYHEAAVPRLAFLAASAWLTHCQGEPSAVSPITAVSTPYVCEELLCSCRSGRG